MRGAILERLYDEQGRVDLSCVAEFTGEPIAQLAKMTPVSAGALRKNPVSGRAQEAAQRFARVLAELIHLLGSGKAAMIWLRAPHQELSGASPLSLILQKQFAAVEGLVHDLASGQPD